MSKSIPPAGAPRRPCRFAPAALASLAVGSAMVGANTPPACAQDAANLYGMQFYVTPYLWLSGIDATIKTPLPRASEVNSSVSAIDLLGHLDGVPFMGAFEVRQGPLAFLGDVLHVPVSTDITTRNVFYQGGKAVLHTNMGTGLVAYRLLDTPAQFADLGLGFRAWSFSANLTLNPGQLVGQSVDRSAGWGDPLIGGRYHYDFGNGFGFTAYGDVGGFGVGAHSDWQLIGTAEYAPNPWLNLRLGYRSLNFNYQASNRNLGYDIHMKGPILAATFRF
jgi:hypothetical protein